MPGQERVLTVVSPDLETEILLRTGRVNRFPLGYPPEDSFVSSKYVPRLRRTIEFDPTREVVTNSPEANAMLRRRYRPNHWAIPKGV